MRRVFIALGFIASLILQTTILPFLSLGGVMPDLLLVLVIFTALFYGSLAGGVVGFVVGLTQDLLGGHYLGLGAPELLCRRLPDGLPQATGKHR